MRNNLSDLNNHLFAELERLSDEDLTEDELEKEIKRAEAITGVAEQVINNADTVLKGVKIQNECGGITRDVPKFIGCSNEKQNI